MPVFTSLCTAAPRELSVDIAPIVAYLVAAVVLIVLLCLFRKRFLKILCGGLAEICLFLACQIFFGEDSLITIIMQWFTAAVACIITVAIVNRIDWGNMRGRPSKTKAPPKSPAPVDRPADETQV